MTTNGTGPGQIEWLRCGGESSDVVISSRVRLARNLTGFPFLGRATTDDRQQIVDVVKARIIDPELLPGLSCLP